MFLPAFLQQNLNMGAAAKYPLLEQSPT
jgi:hypothetical protein